MNKFLKILLIIILFFIVVLAFLFIKSKTWASEFESNINPQYLVTESTELETSLNEKIENYITSKKTTDFISFTPQEVGQIVKSSVIDIVGESSLEIGNIYVEPNNDLWTICGLVRFEKFFNINNWVCTDVTKDNMQTAQLYIQNFKVQGINIGQIYPKLLDTINQGIAEALVTANENGFVGRVFENIELEDNELIVKGSLY
jgi:hypothetical protein